MSKLAQTGNVDDLVKERFGEKSSKLSMDNPYEGKAGAKPSKKASKKAK